MQGREDPGFQEAGNRERLVANPGLTADETADLCKAIEEGALESSMSPEKIRGILAKLKGSIANAEKDKGDTKGNLVFGTPNRYVYIANMQEMGKNPGIGPKFSIERTQKGPSEYLMDENGLVIPGKRGTFGVAFMASGAATYLFECRGFENGYRYRKMEVVKPARLSQDGQVIEKGILSFSEGEREL